MEKFHTKNRRFEFADYIRLPGWLYSGGFHHYDGSTGLKHHRHGEGPELTLVLSGATEWELDDGTPLPQAGNTLGVIQPGMGHRGKREVIEPCAILWLVLRQPQEEEYRPLCRIVAEAGNRVVRADAELLSQAGRLLRELVAPERPGAATMIRLLLDSLLIDAARLLADAGQRQTADRRLMLQVKRRLAANLDRSSSIGGIAAEFKLTGAALSKRFKRCFGLTPEEYLLRQRLDAAALELQANTLPIGEIALRYGFSSSQHFSSAFKRHIGRSPGDFRRNG